jgi:hypothetical protein
VNLFQDVRESNASVVAQFSPPIYKAKYEDVSAVTFVAVSWILNLIWGDGQGFTAEDARAAVISGLIFLLIYSLSTYFFAKSKRKRSTSLDWAHP